MSIAIKKEKRGRERKKDRKKKGTVGRQEGGREEKP